MAGGKAAKRGEAAAGGKAEGKARECGALTLTLTLALALALTLTLTLTLTKAREGGEAKSEANGGMALLRQSSASARTSGESLAL